MESNNKRGISGTTGIVGTVGIQGTIGYAGVFRIETIRIQRIFKIEELKEYIEKLEINMENLGDYYLDLEKVNKLEDTEKDIIHSYYKDMLYRSTDPTQKNVCSSFFNTLDMSGYLKNKLVEDRENKIEIIHG